MDATELLKRMADAYASASTYADRGVVSTAFVSRNGRRIVRRPFLTAFERPHRFRYEFTDESGHGLCIWQTSRPASFLRAGNAEVEPVELIEAIARTTGVSGGSALTVPCLLLPGLMNSWTLAEIEDPIENGQRVIEGVDCVGIRGYGLGDPVELWIGAEDLLIRRIVRTHHFGRSETKEARASGTKVQGTKSEEDSASPVEEYDTEAETLYSPQKDILLNVKEFQPTSLPSRG